MPKDVDPVLLEVIKNGFDSIADEMALIQMKSSYSAIVRDALDFSTAICDAEGRTLAQGLTTPLHLGSFYDAMSFLIKQYEGRIRPGDVFISNDPYTAAGQHLPDIYIIKPIFFEGGLSGWATTVCHHTDVGGIVPGSNALGAKEIYQEGLRLPFLKLYEEGRVNQAILEIIKNNVRVPDRVLGDLMAQIAGCHSGERGYQELFQRYGTPLMTRYIAELHDYADHLFRLEMSEIPDGKYEFSNCIDGLGPDPQPVAFKVLLEIRGDEVTVDWTGTDRQVKGGINSPLPFTKAASYTALRSVMAADMPNCQGYTRAIRIIAPEGTVCNPTPPAACGARGISGFRMIDCLFGALAKALPHRIPADNNGGSTLPSFGGYDGQRAFVFVETLMGNSGGKEGRDGQEGVPHMGANQSNVPIEFIEKDNPLRIERYGFVPDTGGAGRYRGGLSIVREYRALADDIQFSIRSDKRDHPPTGLMGGGPGAPSMNVLNPEKENRVLPVLLTEPEILNRGDVIRHVMAGAGGYGNPFEREPEMVLQDVLNEKVSLDGAEKDYGVAIDREHMEVNLDRTRRLRERMSRETY